MAVPVDVGDIAKVVLRGKFNNLVDTENVWFYRVKSLDPTTPSNNTLEGIAYGLWQKIKSALRAVTSSAQKYLEIEAYWMDVDLWQAVNSDLFPIPSGEQAGTGGAESLPSFVNYSFKFNRPNLLWRHGWKRFTGVPEIFQSNGVITDSTGITAVATLQGVLDDDIFIQPNSDVNLDAGLAEVVIPMETRNTLPVRPVLFEKPISVTYKGLGSQNSRKS